MATPISFPTPPVLQLPTGFFPTTLGGQTQAGQFSTTEQQILAAIADSITTQSSSIVSQGASDLFNTEALLLGQATNLKTVINSLLPLTTISSANIKTLQSIGTSPAAFVEALFSTSPVGNNITPVQLITDLVSAPTNFPKDLVTAISSTTAINTKPSNQTTSFTSISGQTLLLDLVINPQNFISDFSFLFSQTPVGTNPGVTPAQFLKDLFLSPASVPTDIETFLGPTFASWFVGLHPNTTTVKTPNATTLQTVAQDLFSNPTNVPVDILNLTDLGTLGISVQNQVLLGNYVLGAIKNFLTTGQNLIFGDPYSIGTTGKIGFLTNTLMPNSSQEGITFSSAIGFGSSGGYLANLPNDGLPGVSTGSSVPFGFGGYLGYAGAAALMATAQSRHVLHNDTNVFGANVYSDATHLADAIVRLVSSGCYSGTAMIALVEVVGQILTILANINNVLNNLGVPQNPLSFAGGTSSTLTSVNPSAF